MGIVEAELAAFQLSTGQEHVVEYNAGGKIHLHVDTVRIDLTPEEFDHFVSVVLAAEERLDATKAGEVADTDAVEVPAAAEGST